ncbi:MAG TPA: L,D-transpeptidase family protein, partial [Nitrobacter sp.]|nr:L,D-transpeptidase family protein [Nitrobacter sp.]
MRFHLGKSAALPFAILASAVLAGAPAAHAENIFDMLFGRHPRAEPLPMDMRQQRPERPATPRVRAPRVAGPGYRTYKPDVLGKVDFRPLLAAPAPAAFEPSLQNDGFAEAKQGLDGFDLLAEKDIGKALTAYYTQHPQFIWVTGFGPNSRAEQALAEFGDAASYGLNPADYAVTPPPANFSPDDTADRMKDLARFELTLSARVLRYVHDAVEGRVDPNRMSDYYDLPLKPLDYGAVLDALAHTYEVKTYLESRHPQNSEYQALRKELQTLRASAENDIVVDPKTFVRPGETNPEFHKILELLSRSTDIAVPPDEGGVLASHAGSDLYSDDLVPLIKAAQKAKGLKPDGVIGPRTVQALAGTSKAEKIEKVILALEEMRWLPSDLGDPRVFINEPAFMVTFTKGGVDQLSMRAVVGKPTNQTTFFYDQIEQVDFHPYWGVPRSILVNEMLPRLLRDPGYLDRAGYEVTDSKGRRIPSSSIDWGAYGANIPYDVRQQPSEANALGELKILFPNKHAIYMHDTPEKYLFDRDMRAFSHGCVRLQKPREMAAAVLDTTVA